MRFRMTMAVPLVIVMAAGLVATAALHANEPEKSAETPAASEPAAGAATPASGSRTLAEAVKAEKGTLKNPYTDNPQAIEEGKKIYFNYSCNGCHGGGGGGGMCPPLTNEVWIYGSDDDTIFRLIALGSKDLQAAGYARLRTEAVKGPMPGYVEIIDKEDELWKMIAFVRTLYKGRPEKRDW